MELQSLPRQFRELDSREDINDKDPSILQVMGICAVETIDLIRDWSNSRGFMAGRKLLKALYPPVG
jgi:hypothetical protein